MSTSLSGLQCRSLNREKRRKRKYAFFAFCQGTPKEIRLLICISKFLQESGHDAIWSLCNSTPLTCGSQQFGKKNILKCWACTRKMREVLSIFGESCFDLKKHSAQIKFPVEIEKLSFKEMLNYKYREINVGEIAKYSLYARNMNDLVDERWQKGLLRNIESFIITFEAAKRLIEKEKVTDVVVMGGQYMNYRAVMLAAKESDISYFTYENFGVNRIILTKNKECFKFPIVVDDAALAPSEREEAGRYFEDLKSGRYYHKIFNFVSDPEFLSKLKQLPNFISVFPNVSWDSATFYKDSGVFENQYEWLRETIKFCIDTQSNLVIRIHPGEARMSKDFKLMNFIRQWFPRLPPNIVVFDSTDKISSYDIIALSNVACVYVSTMGIEIPYYRIPTIVVGNAYYKDYGFTINPANREDYFSQLKKHCAHKRKIENVDNLLKYMLALQKFRRKIHYGEFLKYTGRQEFGKRRGHSFDFPPEVYEGFPWEKENFCNIIEEFLE